MRPVNKKKHTWHAINVKALPSPWYPPFHTHSPISPLFTVKISVAPTILLGSFLAYIWRYIKRVSVYYLDRVPKNFRFLIGVLKYQLKNERIHGKMTIPPISPANFFETWSGKSARISTAAIIFWNPRLFKTWTQILLDNSRSESMDCSFLCVSIYFKTNQIELGKDCERPTIL